MKCKNCGGELIFQNGMGVCENCKNTYHFDYGFENTEVYICYAESDAQGRRTQDSIIADELYQKLEGKKIHTFYERKSVPSLAGDDVQAVNYQAIYHAKIILVVGTSIAHFEHLVSKYNEYFSGKTVIPVYIDVRPDDLPSELNRVQALNLSTIGADTDLLNGILRLLGREKEIKLEQLLQRTGKRKKIVAIILFLLLIIGIAVVAILLLFRESPVDEPESEPVLTAQETYDNAQALMESGDYLGAADLFATISDYKNSTNLLDEIYNRYDGYYLSEDKSISFYINIQDAATANLILEKTTDGQKVRTEESSVLNNHIITVSFTDSQNNAGKMTITLNNDDIHLTTMLESESEVLSIGNLDLTFLLVQKSDRPMEKGVTSETLIQWMTNRTSLNDLNQAGYQVEFVRIWRMGGGTSECAKVYRIVNTDLKLLVCNFDLSKLEHIYVYGDEERYRLDNYFICGVIAPAKLACPKKIGQNLSFFKEGTILYYPNATDFHEGMHSFFEFSYGEENNSETIQADSLIGITSKKLIGDIDYYNRIYSPYLDEFYKANVGNPPVIDYPYIVREGKEQLLICTTDLGSWKGNGRFSYNVYFYRMNISTREVYLIKIFENIIKEKGEWIDFPNIENYPELFGEFL